MSGIMICCPINRPAVIMQWDESILGYFMKILEIALVLVLAIVYQLYLSFENVRQGWGGEIWSMIESHSLMFLCACILCALCWFMLRLYSEYKCGKNLVLVIGGIFGMFFIWCIASVFVILFAYDMADENLLYRYFSYSSNKNFFIDFAIGLAASVWEEVFFRGVVQTLLVKWLGRILGVLLAAVFFGQMHSKFDDTMYLFALSLGLSFAYTKSLLAGFLAHAFFNLMASFSKFGAPNVVASGYSDVDTVSIAMLHMVVVIFIPLSLMFNMLVFKFLDRWVKRRTAEIS